VARAAFEQMRVAPVEFERDPVAFVDRFLPRSEKGAPLALSAYQRRVLALAFRWEARGQAREATLCLRLLLWSEPKKSGKTLLAAALVIWWAATRPNSEVIVVAADKDQAVGRVFRTVVQLCRANGLEAAKLVRVRASDIEFASGTSVTAIASEYRGAAGSRHSLVVYDELWTYDREALERLYEELTPPPTEPDAWVLVVTYAGFTGESKLLEAMYQRGLAGERVDSELEVYRADDLVMFWSHTPRQPWQTDAYYAEQRRSLRPATFARIHENRWVSSESKFITAEKWDACVDAALTPVLVDHALEVFVAADAALKSDNAAVVAVAWDGTKLRLVAYRIWKPTAQAPLDLEATIEAYIRELCDRFSVCEVVVDPWQMARSVATLKAADVPIRELPQTSGNLTAMASSLWDLIDGGNIRLYAADDLREHALNAVAVETPRGLKIAKEKASRKIDGAVALAMAVMAAVERGPDAAMPLMLIGGERWKDWQQARGTTPDMERPSDEDADSDTSLDESRSPWDRLRRSWRERQEHRQQRREQETADAKRKAARHQAVEDSKREQERQAARDAARATAADRWLRRRIEQGGGAWFPGE